MLLTPTTGPGLPGKRVAAHDAAGAQAGGEHVYSFLGSRGHGSRLREQAPGLASVSKRLSRLL